MEPRLAPHLLYGVNMQEPTFEVESTLQTPKKFSLEIENIVKEKRVSHMDAVIHYCYENEIEPDTVGRLITKSLKEKIEANARELNFLPKHAQLPV